MDDLAGSVALESDDAVLASVPPQLLSLKDGDTFLVGDKRPSSLSFGLSGDNAVFTFHGANLALPPIGGRATPRGVIHLERKRCLHEERLFERVRLTNFGLDEVMLPIAFEYGADFRDMFEVRGMRREVRGV